ncbi:glycosyltransferase family 4 protein [Pseudonocardia sp.]|uniref:glycosyltransferase family 4 protein n=1 Tax=Pseudonocardia sp. TaxID=60912 RepID=UPI002637023E|nr:glycosyltransferase family 4 protein [Pseudonocardia sp.]
MPRTLLVTNDFPPRTGGIQTYLHALTERLAPGELVVYAPAWPGDREFDAAFPHPVVRHPTSLMLPGPSVARRAAGLVREHRARTVWFGASAPLALLGPWLRRHAGVERVVASTHGHEVGWSMLPGARHVLRRIGADADALTTISRHTRGRVAAAFGPLAALEHLPSGIDTRRFAPDPDGRARVRHRFGLGAAPVVVCVSRLVPRKGQDVLVRAVPRLRERVPGVRLLIVGDGPDAPRLRGLAARAVAPAAPGAVVFAGAVPGADLPAYYAAGDVFALPCRTRAGGLDIEGLGIVALEAAACGLPVVVGTSGGAPETVRDGTTGRVVDGRDPRAVDEALAGLLTDPHRAAAMGAAGRAWMREQWSWSARVAQLSGLLHGPSPGRTGVG